MSILREAHDFLISGGDFRTIHNQYGQSGIDILREASSPEATFDSREHYDRRCFPGTRKQYIADIISWVAAPNDTLPSIYWMRGPAGVGKSAIAQTCAEELESIGYLGAAFFFTIRKYDNPLSLFTTIAYQLATTLPDYREILDDRISKDRTLTQKRLSSQFKWLIVEPLRDLEKQGKRVGRRAVFIDGLDECADENAQAEIIGIIASSVRAGSTPFCWVIFSRSEPRIVSTFNQGDITSFTHSVELPISRKADGEIELYLRGEFQNILQRQNGLQLLSSWPTDKDIRTLVNAAAGLFAHPAAVLRFVGYPSDWQFQERLQAVINAILRPGRPSPTSSLAELDALYLLIMSRIPDDILLSTQFLLYWIGNKRSTSPQNFECVTTVCGLFGFSEPVLRRICRHLHAVIAHREYPTLVSSLDPRIDLARSFYDQGQWFQPDPLFVYKLLSVHGVLSFHHKSFYDFLIDPARSSTFCVTTSTVREKFFERCIQQYHHCVADYVIEGSKVTLAPAVTSSSASLSWPQGSEFVDSFLKQDYLVELSFLLSHDNPDLRQHVPLCVLQQLAKLDYRKYLIAERMAWEFSDWSGTTVVGVQGVARSLSHTGFECIPTNKFDAFMPTEFLSMVDQLEKMGVIRPYHPRLGSGRATSILQNFSRKKSIRRSSGLYKLGHGEKSVVWYWEFDVEKRYFHQFRTIDYAAATEFYKANKFTMWKGEDTEDEDEDDGEDDNEDEDIDDEDRGWNEPNDSDDEDANLDNGEGKGPENENGGRGEEDMEIRKKTIQDPLSEVLGAEAS